MVARKFPEIQETNLWSALCCCNCLFVNVDINVQLRNTANNLINFVKGCYFLFFIVSDFNNILVCSNKFDKTVAISA